ncbi:MAG TPA: sigma factor-like helix-turn-helix DNA-binding protein [Candidatus Acidoferrum sp.]
MLYPDVKDESLLARQATPDFVFTMPVRWIADRHSKLAPSWREDGEVSRLDLTDPSTNPEREYMNKELASKVLEELSPPLRNIFLLCKIEGWTNKEITAKFGLPSQRVKHRVFRARTILHKKLVSLSTTSEPVISDINTAA